MSGADVEIWHNPRCRKSREALAWLEARGVRPRVRRYLDDPPTPEELRRVLAMLGLRPEALMRRQEKAYKELVRGRALSEEEQIRILCAHPKLIERPIVIVDGARAIVARPAEKLSELLGG